jgi:excisionase family DNA binding protein
LSINFPEEPITPGDWISQAEAARLRGVSRQAISNLARKGRLKTLDIGGHVLVSRSEVEQFVPLGAGRPAGGEDADLLEEIRQLLERCSLEQRQNLFKQLREEFAIHSLEKEFHAPAELILEAIARAPDISKRGVRGLIAEAAFEIYVVHALHGWVSLPVPNEASYDFQLHDSQGTVRVQVKTQRRKSEQVTHLSETITEYRPMTARDASRSLPAHMYVVETQRTRGGKNAAGEATRPYRFDEFDILAVSMYPSTQDWKTFMYTVMRWLLPRSEDDRLLQVFQPVSAHPDNVWTDDFATCVEWLRSREQRTVLRSDDA